MSNGCGNDAKEPQVDLEKVSEFEGGRLYKAGKIYVAQLNGDYREMGRQYGGLMKSQIKQFYEEAIDGFFEKNEQVPRAMVESQLVAVFAMYPARLQRIIKGMEETSGMSQDQLVMVDSAVGLPFLASMLPQCSFVAAWGEYTTDGTLVAGRSLDYLTEFQEYNDTLTVAVFNPDDGSQSIATIVNAGQIGTMNVFNNAKLAMGVDDGMPSGGPDFRSNVVPTIINNVSFFLDASDMAMINAYMFSSIPNFALIFNVVDPKTATTFEKTTTECKERGGQEDGLLVATNHFIEPTWNLQQPTEGVHESAIMENSTTRYEGLMKAGEQNKGKINADVMKKMFDVPISEGGPTQPESTIYQFVTVPAELELWVKAYEYQDWVKVDLDELFN